MIKAIRGTRDLLPPDTALWNFVESTVSDVFRAYNFQEIRTPIMEATDLFARGVGEETDIVTKEMFTWYDKARAESEKGQSLTLRPENTAGVVRAYIEHDLGKRGLNKLFYIGPQFRRERPAKGRYRQFYQMARKSSAPPLPAANLRLEMRKSSNCSQPCSIGLEFRTGPSSSTRLAVPPIAPATTKPCARRSIPSRIKCASTASAARLPILCVCSTAKFPKTSRSSKSCHASANFSTRPAVSTSSRYRKF